MDQSAKAEQFRQLHRRDHPFILPNPWDAGSAKILEGMGFEALATTSAGVDHLNAKLSGMSGRQAAVENVRLVASASSLPVAADLEDCYPEAPGGIAETIRMAADAGAVGGSIEDAVRLSPGAILDLDAAVANVEKAVNAARQLPFPFTLCARCESHLFADPDLDDTVSRLNAYAEAGADLVYAPGLRTVDELKAVVASVGVPVNVLLGLPNTSLTMADMHRLGVKRVSLGSALHRVAMRAFIDAAEEIRAKGTFTFTSGLPGAGALDRFFGDGS